MKRINNKGFTLVELLAVIIILAIVVGITIPAVLTMVDEARTKAGQDGAAVMADWIDKQYGLVSIGFGTPDAAFTAACGAAGATCDGDTEATISGTNKDAFVLAAGLKPADVDTLKIKINKSSGRSCVKITAASGGNFYVARDGSNQATLSGGTCPNS